jgi:hypothetical protein
MGPARITHEVPGGPGLAQDPVYVDPESPRMLDEAQLSRLHDRIERFGRSEGGGPVYVAVVPHLPEDESAGDEELFAAAVRAKLSKADGIGEADGVYVVADPLDGYIDFQPRTARGEFPPPLRPPRLHLLRRRPGERGRRPPPGRAPRRADDVPRQVAAHR